MMDSGIALHEKNSLVKSINMNGIFALNCPNDNSKVRDVFVTGGSLESDDDAELLIQIPFNDSVNVTGFKIHCDNEKSAPKEVFVYKNRANMDFDDVERNKATQKVKIQSKKAKEGSVINLRRTKFTNTNCLTFYIKENNMGTEETTRIRRIEIVGENKGSVDMGKFQACKS